MFWYPGVGWTAGHPPAQAPLVVDSWLVEDGLVRGMPLHASRFASACARGDELGELTVADFIAAVSARLPRSGVWFPRVEAYGDTRLALWLRPAPRRRISTRLWVPPTPDPRRHPTIKGPDLAVLAALRARAVTAGADDAVLYAPDGTVLESAHAALMWWRGETLCLPDPGLAVLPSVTSGLVVRIAEERGVPVRYERLHVGELFDSPVWTANALHGLRRVSGHAGRDFAWWRAVLAATAAPLDLPAGVGGGT